MLFLLTHLKKTKQWVCWRASIAIIWNFFDLPAAAVRAIRWAATRACCTAGHVRILSRYPFDVSRRARAQAAQRHSSASGHASLRLIERLHQAIHSHSQSHPPKVVNDFRVTVFFLFLLPTDIFLALCRLRRLCSSLWLRVFSLVRLTSSKDDKAGRSWPWDAQWIDALADLANRFGVASHSSSCHHCAFVRFTCCDAGLCHHGQAARAGSAEERSSGGWRAVSNPGYVLALLWEARFGPTEYWRFSTLRELRHAVAVLLSGFWKRRSGHFIIQADSVGLCKVFNPGHCLLSVSIP